MRRLLLFAALIATTGLFAGKGGGDGPNLNRSFGNGSPVNGITSGAASIKGAAKAAEPINTVGRSDLDAMGHELGPGQEPIYPTPDGFKPTDNVDIDGAADFLPNGSPIFHGETFTRIGADEQTVNNQNHIAPMEGVHDIIVHGEREGWLSVDGNFVNPQQMIPAIQNNPNYEGGPIRLLVCHSGSSGVAQEIANTTGVPVFAPSDRVGTIRILGPGQTPTVDNGGTFDWYHPEN